MNPWMTRWKVTPSKNGSCFGAPVFGSFHSRLPSASSTKLRTVLGAWSGKSSSRMSPRLVCRVACRGVES